MPRKPQDLVGWIRDWCADARPRVAAGERVRSLSLCGMVAELAEALPERATGLATALVLADNASGSVSRLDEFSAVFDGAVAGLPPAAAEPVAAAKPLAYVGQDGKTYAVRVLPTCAVLTGPDGVSKFVWHGPDGKLKADAAAPT